MSATLRFNSSVPATASFNAGLPKAHGSPDGYTGLSGDTFYAPPICSALASFVLPWHAGPQALRAHSAYPNMKTLEGFNIPYLPGWNCHGLPIKINVGRNWARAKALR